MQVCFIINLDRCDILLQQMESQSPKFTLSQKAQLYEKNKIKQTFILRSFPHFASEVDKINLTHTKSKTFFLFITQIPVRTYMETKQQIPRRKGQASSHPCDTETLCHLKKKTQLKPNKRKGKQDKIKCHSQHMVGQIPKHFQLPLHCTPIEEGGRGVGFESQKDFHPKTEFTRQSHQLDNYNHF